MYIYWLHSRNGTFELPKILPISIQKLLDSPFHSKKTHSLTHKQNPKNSDVLLVSLFFFLWLVNLCPPILYIIICLCSRVFSYKSFYYTIYKALQSSNNKHWHFNIFPNELLILVHTSYLSPTSKSRKWLERTLPFSFVQKFIHKACTPIKLRILLKCKQ